MMRGSRFLVDLAALGASVFVGKFVTTYELLLGTPPLYMADPLTEYGNSPLSGSGVLETALM